MFKSNPTFLLVLLCLLTINSCYIPRIERSVLEHLDLYKELVVNIEKEKDFIFKKDSKRINFYYAHELADFAAACGDCLTSKTVQEIKVQSALRGFVVSSNGHIIIFLKKDSGYYMTDYHHSLIFSRKSVPISDNSEGSKLLFQKKVDKQWYYRIVRTTN